MALPSMHRVLDVAETMAEEGAAAGADSPQEAQAAVTALRDKLYRPELGGGSGRRAASQVYTDEETEESFDAFVAGAAG